jgi:hypothetical protein
MDAMTLQTLWKAHRERLFPALARGAEECGTDLVVLDCLVAGCVASIVGPGAQPSAEKLSLLSDLAQQVRDVCSSLEGEAKDYFVHLEQLAVAAIEVAQNTGNNGGAV